jgi:two-component system, OmpR family, manganese sensing sensor histidine kinase
MVWAIVLGKPPNAFKSQLLLSYLAVMLTLFSGAIVWVYAFTRHSLYTQLDQRLVTLAQAAADSLLEVKTQAAQETSDYLDPHQPESVFEARRQLDYDGDLDIPWQQLRETEQGVEWFDAEQKMVGQAGKISHVGALQPGHHRLLRGEVRAMTLTVHAQNSQQIEGYIRTSESTAEVNALLQRFRWGLGIGGGVLLSLTGLGGIWLTRQSLKPIEKSFEQLKQFTADAAHELRSPLTTLKTSVQVMQCYPERIHAKDVQKLAAIAASTDQMIRLVEDLLLLSRMDDNSIVQSQLWEPVLVDQLLRALLELLALQAKEKQIELRSNLTVKSWVIGDASQLQRLFKNLLENAIQYTPSGGVVTVSMVLEGAFVLVRIEDTGIGIAPEVRSRVFDRFWRADEARDRRTSGMGMGLAIAKTIAERHRGKITLSSQMGVGSCFQVSLPLA